MSDDIGWAPRRSNLPEFDTRWNENHHWLFGLLTQILGSIYWKGEVTIVTRSYGFNVQFLSLTECDWGCWWYSG